MEVTQHRRGLRQRQQAGRATVEAVAELQFGQFGPEMPERFDHPGRDIGAPVDGHAGRFVDDQEVLVFVDDGTAQRIEQGGGHGRLRGRSGVDPQFGNADDIAGLQSVVLLCLATVDAQPALPQQPEQQPGRD